MLKTPFLLAVLCLLLTAPSLAHGSFVYVTNYGDGTVSQFRANPNGTLTPLNPPSVKAYPRCHSLAVARGRFLYALSSLEFSRRDCLISQFCIEPDGRLIPLSPATVLVPYDGEGGGPSLIVTNPSGGFLYAASRSGGLAQFGVKTDGTLALLSPPIVARRGGTLNNTVALDRLHLRLYFSLQSYMSTANVGEVTAFEITLSGILRLLPEESLEMEALTPERVLIAQGGRILYLLYNAGFDSSGPVQETYKVLLAQYRTPQAGKLLSLRPPRISLPGQADIALVDPQSRYCILVV